MNSRIWPAPAAAMTSFGWIAAALVGRARALTRECDASFRLSVTAYGPDGSTETTEDQNSLPMVDTRPHRWSDATTSAEVISRPSWNRTPRRSVMV